MRTTITRTDNVEHTDGHHQPRSVRHMIGAFIGTFIAVGFFLIAEAITHGLYLWRPRLGVEAMYFWVFGGAILAVLALGVGGQVARRKVPLIWWHAAITLMGTGAVGGLTTVIGWVDWWDVAHIFAACIVAGSWNLYRIDAFRSAASKSDDTGGWAAAIGLLRSRARVRHEGAMSYIDVTHGPGETVKDVQRASDKIEDAVGAIAGRVTVTAGDRGGTSTVALQMTDPFEPWRPHPGPSHPGRSIAYPLRTAYYATGQDQWFALIATTVTSPYTTFRAGMASFIGAAGVTGSGKTGFLMGVATEVLTRCDAVLGWVDAEKLAQNAGWCLDMLALAAPDKPRARNAANAIKLLADYRVGKFGQAALDAVLDPNAPQIGREWTPQLAIELGSPLLVVIIDEADTVIDTKAWKWLFARGRSLGIIPVPATPRVSTAEVPAIIRGSIATWKTFSIGDNYSGTFSITQETIDAGADPSRLRGPGLHFLDMAPGVDPRKYPVLSREFQSDPAGLRRMVLQARTTFTPMPLPADELAAMNVNGDLDPILPRMVMKVAMPGADRDAQEALDLERTQPVPATDDPDDDDDQDSPADQEADDPMNPTPQGTVVEDDEVAPLDLLTACDGDDELAREIAAQNPRTPIPVRHPTDPITLADPDDKPKAQSAAEADAALDAALVRMVEAGWQTFHNADLMDWMAVSYNSAFVSRRLTALADGERIAPPGITIEREGRGGFRFVRSAPQPTPRTRNGA